MEEDSVTKTRRKESIIATACTMRVLNILRHWISKHIQDFEKNELLRYKTLQFLDEIIFSSTLSQPEYKAATKLVQLLVEKEQPKETTTIQELLSLPACFIDSIETLSALEIAEQLAYIEHRIFVSISCEEFLHQAWLKADRLEKAPNICLMTKRFNDVSRLVMSEILRRSSVSGRVAAIEKWTAIADISRCLHNYNGVLEIMAAFTNTYVFRLKKTWEKVSKTTRYTVDKLQATVSCDGRFRALRNALHHCDPPCVPYLGLYLADLAFIEEGTPDITDEGLVNFSKMRMIAHVIREIRHFQQTAYKIDFSPRVVNYLLDTTTLLSDEELYRISLQHEPRAARLSQATISSLPSVPWKRSFKRRSTSNY